MTPRQDRLLFSDMEWSYGAYTRFFEAVRVWWMLAQFASDESDEFLAIRYWKDLLGDHYFPWVAS